MFERVTGQQWCAMFASYITQKFQAKRDTKSNPKWSELEKWLMAPAPTPALVFFVMMFFLMMTPAPSFRVLVTSVVEAGPAVRWSDMPSMNRRVMHFHIVTKLAPAAPMIIGPHGTDADTAQSEHLIIEIIVVKSSHFTWMLFHQFCTSFSTYSQKTHFSCLRFS